MIKIAADPLPPIRSGPLVAEAIRAPRTTQRFDQFSVPLRRMDASLPSGYLASRSRGVNVGASGWSYYVAYQPDLQVALDGLRRQVFETGDYWWAVPYEYGKSAADFPNRPMTEAELWADESVQESGTHSILDMSRILADGEEPGYGTIQPVIEAEAIEYLGTRKLTRSHVEAIEPLANRSWFGRCAVLHDADGNPSEIYFWGSSGD
ncbi:hypothetical protein [Micromonospora sp. NPDC049107]|uniref:hypothetical protein n=1 Tax=Micromonospora sp. NPDC049107 TaxID=3154349 RepID=UPI0033FA0B59